MRIYLQAINPQQNILRYYEIVHMNNLFREPSLIVRYGRIGTRGNHKIYSFETEAELQKKTSAILKRRLNSQKRLGVNYQIMSPKELI